MALTRSFLDSLGITDKETQEKIMAERGRLLNGYVPQVDVQAQIDAAVAAKEPVPIDPKTTEEYKALLGENEKLKALATDDFANVKAPYRDIVWGKLDHGADHKPYSEQLATVREEMPDLFGSEAKNTPQFSQAQGMSQTNPKSAEDEAYEQALRGWNSQF